MVEKELIYLSNFQKNPSSFYMIIFQCSCSYYTKSKPYHQSYNFHLPNKYSRKSIKLLPILDDKMMRVGGKVCAASSVMVRIRIREYRNTSIIFVLEKFTIFMIVICSWNSTYDQTFDSNCD